VLRNPHKPQAHNFLPSAHYERHHTILPCQKRTFGHQSVWNSVPLPPSVTAPDRIVVGPKSSQQHRFTTTSSSPHGPSPPPHGYTTTTLLLRLPLQAPR